MSWAEADLDTELEACFEPRPCKGLPDACQLRVANGTLGFPVVPDDDIVLDVNERRAEVVLSVRNEGRLVCVGHVPLAHWPAPVASERVRVRCVRPDPCAPTYIVSWA